MPPTSTAPTTGPDDELAPLLADVREGAARITEIVDGLVAAVNGAIDTMPPVVARWAHEEFAKVTSLVNEALAQTGRILSHAGDPAALRRAADTWLLQVGAPVSALAAVSTLTTVEADDHWQGVAATAYKNTLPAQSAAFTAVKATTDRLSDVLHAMATAVVVFWLGVASALATLLGALLVAAGVAATGAGVPVALGLTGAELAAFITALVATIAAFTAALTTSASQAGVLSEVVANNTAYPGARWPRSTTDLGDGSLEDGDDTDWTIAT